MRTIILLALCQLLTGACIAQPKVDSLQKVLNRYGQDSNRVNTLCALSDALENADAQKAIAYAQEGLLLARKISFTKGIGNCLNALGNAYSTAGESEVAFQYYKERQKLARETRDSFGIAASYDNIGILYSQWGKVDSALMLRKEAIKIYAGLHDEKHLANGYIWVGNLLTNRSDYTEALDYYLKSIKILERLQDPNLGYAYINLSNIYRLNKQFVNAKKYALEGNKSFTRTADKYGIAASLYRLALVNNDEGDHRSAIENLLKAKQLFKETGDVQTVAATDNLIGDTYRQMGDYNNAEPHLKDALFTAKRISDHSLVAVATGNLGTLYKEQGNYPQAMKYVKESYLLLKSLNNRNTAHAIKDLVEVYAHMNIPDSTLNYFLLYQQTMDTIYSDETAKSIAETQTKFETGKKADSLLLQQKIISLKNRSITTKNYFIASLSVLALVVTGLLMVSLKQSKKIKLQLGEIQQLQSELTHRTSNFFNAIKGILSLAMTTTTDRDTVSSIDKRVNTMNHLYKTLYTGTNQHLDFSEVLSVICRDLEHSYGAEKNIRIYSKCTAAINKKEAGPLAFVVTELLTNCYKHAFTGMNQGEVHAEITDEEGSRLLHVWDNGKGLKEETPLRVNSQGLTIIKNYCKVLSGEMSTWNENGFHFKMKF